MASPQASKPPAVILDASFLIGYCAKEANKFVPAQQELLQYAQSGWHLFAPGVLMAEVLFVLCRKAQDAILTPSEHAQAVASFAAIMKAVHPPPRGDTALIPRAEAIRAGFGCARANDSFYLALAEELAVDRQVELVTFDDGWENQAKANSPGLKVRVLATV